MKRHLIFHLISLYCHYGIGNFIPDISLSQIHNCYSQGGDLIGLSFYHALLLLLLFLAAYMDLKTDRIPNKLIVAGIVSGISGTLWFCLDFRQTAFSVFLAFLLLYPLFKIGALGAGDVKIFIMIGSFLAVREYLTVMVLSFLIGAFFSLVKIFAERNGRERMRYFLSYISEVGRTGQWKIYGEQEAQEKQQYYRNKIHFAVPVLFGTVLQIGAGIQLF